jgi:coenzyme PQQ precursor peptide PqqA
MHWEKPRAIDLRFGMEITMYIATRQSEIDQSGRCLTGPFPNETLSSHKAAAPGFTFSCCA